MSEAWLLWLVARYPHPAALARRVRHGSLFAALARLEAHGLITHRREQYRLTRRGIAELATARAIAQLVVRSHLA